MKFSILHKYTELIKAMLSNKKNETSIGPADIAESIDKTIALDQNFSQLNKFILYKSAMDIIRPDVNIQESVNFEKKLSELTEYMLGERFQMNKTSKKDKPQKRDEEGNLLIEKKDIDLIKYYGEKKDDEIKKNLIALDVIKFYKILEQLFLSNNPDTDITKLQLGFFTTKGKELIDSLPKLLLSVFRLNPEEQKSELTFIFSAITIYRQFKVKTKPDLSTVTAPYNGENIDYQIKNNFAIHNIEEGGRSNFPDETLKKELITKVYAGNASSPNSGASAINMFKDVNAVRKDKKLEEAIRLLTSNFINYGEFYQDFGTFLLTKSTENDENAIHSRLFHFTAPGGKSRIIANVDGITQTALSSLHYGFFDLLSTLSSDFTFNHPKGLDHVFTDTNHNYYSIDLSAATDRMPRILQGKIIHALFALRGKEDQVMIEESGNTIVDREYCIKDMNIPNLTKVRYTVGQGMGLFTSGPIMALTHHYIVNYLVGIEKERYAIVGDDLVFRGSEDEYNNYIKIMNSIGISVNLTKTIKSISGKPCNIEFARNYIINGQKIVPIKFGTLFAWLDEKTSLDTFLFQTNGGLNFPYLLRFVKIFRIYLTNKKLAALMLYYGKNNIEANIIKNKRLLLSVIPRGIIEDINYRKIIEICNSSRCAHRGEHSSLAQSNVFRAFSLTSNLASQLTVRKEDEVHAAIRLAKTLDEGAVIDTPLGRYSNEFYQRLYNVEIISYDADYLGNPLIRKNERRLTEKIVNDYLKKFPDLK